MMASQQKNQTSGYGNVLKNNRVVPKQSAYNSSAKPSKTVRKTWSSQSKGSHDRALEDHSPQQRPSDYNDADRSFNSDKKIYSNNDRKQSDAQTSCCFQPGCFGLTRLTSCILFGTLTTLAIISLGGIGVSTYLYVNDSSTDSLWKILGMALSGALLVAVIITFCIVLCCYKAGCIRNKKSKDTTPDVENQKKKSNRNKHLNKSPLPYNVKQNGKISSKEIPGQTHIENETSDSQSNSPNQALSTKNSRRKGASTPFPQKSKNAKNTTVLIGTNQKMGARQPHIIHVTSTMTMPSPTKQDGEERIDEFSDTGSEYESIKEKALKRIKEGNTDLFLLTKYGAQPINNLRKVNESNNVSVKPFKTSGNSRPFKDDT